MKDINRLKEIGFIHIGNWILKNDKIAHTIKDTTPSNFLYAFVVNDKIKYIGKSIKTIKERFDQYITPGESQTTNIKNNTNIKEQLHQKNNVEIYTLIDDNKLKHGDFNVSLPAGLEDDLIKKIQLEWNG